nr:unnamed protein product [Callosobruchus analis]
MISKKYLRKKLLRVLGRNHKSYRSMSYCEARLHKSKPEDWEKNFFGRDDVSRATAGKKEIVTFKKNKMQKRYLLDNMKNLYTSFKIENPTLRCSSAVLTDTDHFMLCLLLPLLQEEHVCVGYIQISNTWHLLCATTK